MSDSTLETEATLKAQLLGVAGTAAMGAAYRKSWSPEFSADEVEKAWTKPTRAGSLTTNQLVALGRAKLRDYGFGLWDKEGDLHLIPLWAWPLIADGERLTDIGGETAVKGADEIDLDVRFGCIAFGFDVPREAA